MAIKSAELKQKQKKSLTDYVGEGLNIVKTGVGAANGISELVGGVASTTMPEIATKPLIKSPTDFTDFINSADKMKRRWAFLSQG
jgi:hypothetical protein